MNRQPTDVEDRDDYFASTRMSLGDHLEELRMALWRAIKGLLIGMIVGFCLARTVTNLISRPVELQLEVFYKDRVNRKMKELRDETQANKEGLLAQLNKPQPILVEVNRFDLARALNLQIPNGETFNQFAPTLRKCHSCHGSPEQQGDLRLDSQEALIQGGRSGKVIDPDNPEQSLLLQAIRRDGKLTKHPVVAVSGAEIDGLMSWIKDKSPWPQEESTSLLLYVPMVEWVGKMDRATREVTRPPFLKALGIAETIITWMKIGFYLGLILSSPWIFYQIWMFVAAGLYHEEKRLVNYYLPGSIALFLSGVVLCYLVLPFGIQYLLSFNAWMNVEPDLRLTEWLSFAIMMPLIFGIAFQLPLVMFFLDRLSILSVDFYIRHWKMFLFVLLILSGFFQAAPDPGCMIMLAIPMWCLYGLGILMCKMVPKQPSDLNMPDREETIKV